MCTIMLVASAAVTMKCWSSRAFQLQCPNKFSPGSKEKTNNIMILFLQFTLICFNA